MNSEHEKCRYCGTSIPSVYNYCPSHPEPGGQCEAAPEPQGRPYAMYTGWQRGIHGDLDGEALVRWVAELEATVERLPKTADGVPVVPVPSVHVYRVLSTGRIQENTGWQDGQPRFRACEPNEKSFGWLTRNVELCYSTREAAEAGGKAKPEN